MGSATQSEIDQWEATRAACLTGIIGYSVLLLLLGAAYAMFATTALIAWVLMGLAGVVALLIVLLAVAFSLYSFCLWGARRQLDRHRER